IVQAAGSPGERAMPGKETLSYKGLGHLPTSACKQPTPILPVQWRRLRALMVPSSATLYDMKRIAREAAKRAYAPYSSFAVGAAVLGDTGAIHAGANVENASFGLSICAERNAIFRAVAEGERTIRAVCLYTPTTLPSTPCGACRQVLFEFGPDALIICCTDDDAERRYALRDLVPEEFRHAK